MHIFRYDRTEINRLSKRDRKPGKSIDEIGLIERLVTPYLFIALVAGIASPQVSTKAAESIRATETDGGAVRHCHTGCHHRYPSEGIQQCGMSL